MNTINQTIDDNLQQLRCDKNQALALVDYHEGVLTLSGQHEQMIVVRSSGRVEQSDTIDLSFPMGLTEDISDFVAEARV